MRFSDIEISELTKAWLTISLAFAIIWRGMDSRFWLVYLMAALTVGVAFIVHELSHKYIAQKYGCWAEFRSYQLGLILAILMSFIGFIFAAPGAVIISGLVTQEENGRISMAGPVSNLILASVFYFIAKFGLILLQPMVPISSMIVITEFVQISISINAWLAFFNLLPFGPLDGVKIMQWSQKTWFGLVLIAGFFIFFLQ